MKLITREPDRIGPAGKAWRIDLKAVAAHLQKPVGATLQSWFVEAPHAHPCWCNYLITAVHLRPTEGVPVATLYFENATHEVFLFALAPDMEPDFLNPISTRLTPINFAGQWTAASDIDADSKIEGCVEDIVNGILNPDTDARSQWYERFSRSNVKQ